MLVRVKPLDLFSVLYIEKQFGPDAFSLEEFERYMLSLDSDFFVYKNQESVIGYAIINKFPKYVYVESIAIDKAYSGRGYGTMLMLEIEEMYPSMQIKLDVSAQNDRARHVYKKLGYEEIGINQTFLYKDQSFPITMVKNP